jgi:hypothetical protein
MPRHADKHRMSVTHRAGAPVRGAASLGVWLFVLGGFSGPLATTPLRSSSHDGNGGSGRPVVTHRSLECAASRGRTPACMNTSATAEARPTPSSGSIDPEDKV